MLPGIIELERIVTSTPGVDGLVLRYGFLYGPGTDGTDPADGPTVHVVAAADAAARAVDRGVPGIYNIADDGGIRHQPQGSPGTRLAARHAIGRTMADLEAIEARIWAMLEPYRDRLEPATIYGIPSLRWPGAKAHDYFAAVKAGKSYVSLYLLVADTYPEALEGASPALLKRRSGKATFNFPRLDDELARDLEALLARLFERYAAAHVAT